MENDLVHIAAEASMRAAVRWLDNHPLATYDDTVLVECLRSQVKASFREALRDTKEAIMCGMDDVARHTFAATMVVAGIKAAQEACHAN